VSMIISMKIEITPFPSMTYPRRFARASNWSRSSGILSVYRLETAARLA
jgi:hypothetical protein